MASLDMLAIGESMEIRQMTLTSTYFLLIAGPITSSSKANRKLSKHAQIGQEAKLMEVLDRVDLWIQIRTLMEPVAISKAHLLLIKRVVSSIIDFHR